MQLILPNKKYEKSWQEAILEFQKDEGKIWGIPEEPCNIEKYIKKKKEESEGKNLPSNLVPSTTYWLIDKNKFIGHLNLRHKLNERLKKTGCEVVKDLSEVRKLL